MSRSKILIFTNKDDAHADALVDLSDRLAGVECIRLNTEDLFGNARYSITPDNFSLQIIDANRSCSLSEISGAWYRRPKPARVTRESPPGHEEFFVSEAWEIVHGLYAMCANSNCAPGSDFAVRPSNKIRQLFMARKLGFRVPASYVGNDFRELEQFFGCNPQVVLKTLRWPSLETPDLVFPMYAAAVDGVSILQASEQYDNGLPLYAQARIPKAADIRVVVVGASVFGFSMQAAATSAIDIREVDEAEVAYTEVSVPDSIVTGLRRMMALDNLVYSAADFIIDVDGQWWFLENNPNGQFYWLERKTGAPVLQALADLLAKSVNAQE